MQKTAIVTGAYGNLGQAVVKKLIAAGFKVEGSVMPGENVPAGFPTEGFTAHSIDLTNEDAAAAWIKEITATRGDIGAAVLTVGGFAMGSITDTTSADIAKQYKLNFETTYHTARPVFTRMLQQEYGRIFFIGARPGLNATYSKGMTAYGLAKSLVIRLAELMNEEAAGTNVVTSVIIPSTIDTPQNRKAMPDADFSKWVTPEAIAGIISFHCSEEASALREPLLKVYGNL